MGSQQSKSSKTGQREIKVRNIWQRIDKDQLTKLRNEFDRIQEAGVSADVFSVAGVLP